MNILRKTDTPNVIPRYQKRTNANISH